MTKDVIPSAPPSPVPAPLQPAPPAHRPPPPAPPELNARRPLILGFLTVAVLVFGFGGWSMLTTIDGAVVSPGVIEVDQNRQVVEHPDGGVVAEIRVVEAQHVQAGDLLVRLDGSLLQSELAIVEGQLFEAMARKARLEAERDGLDAPTFTGEIADLAATRPDVAELIEGQRKLFAARLETFRAQQDQLQHRLEEANAQTEGIKAQIAATKAQLAILEPELAGQRQLLAQGLTQSVKVRDLETTEASLKGNLGELQANQAQSEGRATEVQLQVIQLESQRREDANTQLRDLGPQALQFAEKRRSLSEQIARLDVRAPVSGVVLGLQVTAPKSVIRPAEPILYIVPQDRPLVIVAQVSPIHVDEIHVGQPVRVSFPAFPTRTTPQLSGQLVNISADALSDQRTGATYYRAEISLDPGEVEKLEGKVLIPGMPVQAYIETEERTPMAYLLKPFTDYFRLAFRES